MGKALALISGVGGVTAGHSQAKSGVWPLLPSCSPAALSPRAPICGVPASLPHFCSQLLLWRLCGDSVGGPEAPTPSTASSGLLEGCWGGEGKHAVHAGRTQQSADKHPLLALGTLLFSRHPLPLAPVTEALLVSLPPLCWLLLRLSY